MQFFTKKTVAQQVEVAQARRFTTGQYLAAVGAMLLSVTAISYAAGLLTLTQFSSGSSISSSAVNANFQKINDELLAMKTALVPAGTLIAFSGTTVPAGFKRCPTTIGEATVNRADFPALFSAIAVTWGAGDSVNTFVMPWFPEGYTLIQANSANLNISEKSEGQVIAHSHTPPPGLTAPWLGNTLGGGDGAVDGSTTITPSDRNPFGGNTGITGGTANFAAGTKVMILVKI